MELARSRPITPTALVLFEQCPSKFLFTREKFLEKLSYASLFSIKGTLMHELIENYSVTGELPTLTTVDSILERHQLQHKWLGDIEKWPEKWTLRKLIGVVERSNILHSARKKLLTYRAYIAINKTVLGSASDITTAASEANPYGVELEYQQEELELEGRADLTYGEGLIATVVDFKSGQTKCKEGKLKREYYLQLGAYGLMLQRFSTAKTIMLKAEGSDTTSNDLAFKFDQDHRSAIINLCKEIISTFPRGKMVQLDPLARSGEHCRYCSGKRVCKTFAASVKQVQNYAEVSQMGSVLAHDIVLETTSSGWMNLTFRSITGKEGRVTNVPPIFLVGLFDGDSAFLHNLRWSSKFSDGAIYNFYVANPSRPQESSFDFAWHKLN